MTTINAVLVTLALIMFGQALYYRSRWQAAHDRAERWRNLANKAIEWGKSTAHPSRGGES